MTAPVPPEVDTTVPSASRMYDYYLGGGHHFSADREAADRVLALAPWTREMAMANRAFLRRIVTYLVRDAGIRQFLDLGSGIPTLGNVHEIAQDLAADARVAYVEVDPVAVAHARLILACNPYADVIAEDIRDPAAVLGHPTVRTVLDFDSPIAVLMVSILPFVTDADHPGELIAAYLNALAAGGFLALSHASLDGLSAELRARVGQAAETYAKAGQPVTLRTVGEIAGWFAGLDLVEPGVVPLQDWRPDGTDPGFHPMLSYGGVGRLP